MRSSLSEAEPKQTAKRLDPRARSGTRAELNVAVADDVLLLEHDEELFDTQPCPGGKRAKKSGVRGSSSRRLDVCTRRTHLAWSPSPVVSSAADGPSCTSTTQTSSPPSPCLRTPLATHSELRLVVSPVEASQTMTRW